MEADNSLISYFLFGFSKIGGVSEVVTLLPLLDITLFGDGLFEMNKEIIYIYLVYIN